MSPAYLALAGRFLTTKVPPLEAPNMLQSITEIEKATKGIVCQKTCSVLGEMFS